MLGCAIGDKSALDRLRQIRLQTETHEMTDEPLLIATLIMAEDDASLTAPYEIRELLDDQEDLFLDCGYCGV